ALGKGEWTDKSQPLVDTVEFRQLLTELSDYRETALGLIARHLNKGFQAKKILVKAFWDHHAIRQSTSGNEANLPPDARLISARSPLKGLRWNIAKDAVEAEMRRQGTTAVDFKFCLNWHREQFQSDGPLVKNLLSPGFPSCSNDLVSLCALVHFMVLENLELIASEDGSQTVLGNVICDTPTRLQEPCLVALEMLKFGILHGEPFEAADRSKPFPEQVNYPVAPVDPGKKAALLLSRVMSLVPMKLKNEMWNADVIFDLAAFHSLVRVLKRSLRQIVEGSLVSVLLRDLQRVKLLWPRGQGIPEAHSGSPEDPRPSAAAPCGAPLGWGAAGLPLPAGAGRARRGGRRRVAPGTPSRTLLRAAALLATAAGWPTPQTLGDYGLWYYDDEDQASGGYAAPPRRGSPAPAGGIQSVRFESPTVPVPASSPEEIDLGELDSGDLRHLLARAGVNWSSGAQWIIFLCQRQEGNGKEGEPLRTGSARGPEGTSLDFALKLDEVQARPALSPAGRLPQGFLEELPEGTGS
ncbi:unnamed protein product, partial [Prorocentrum cordatum]